MDEKRMTLGNLVEWLDSNDIFYEVDSAGRLTVKGSLRGYFRDWVETCRYTSLPDELFCVNGDLWMGQTSIVSLGGLTSVEGNLSLQDTSITSLGDLASVGWSLVLQGAPITSPNDLPQVGGDLHLDQHQLRLLTREVLQKVTGGIRYWDQATEKWIALSPDELEAILAENERRESLNSVRESDVDWDLYDR